MSTKPSILVIDDDPFMRAFAETVLSGAGFKVVLAASAADGVARYREARPALIVLDFAMPGQSGRWALQALRALGGMPPVLMVSAWRSEEAEDDMRRLGAQWLEKPISAQALIDAVAVRLAA